MVQSASDRGVPRLGTDQQRQALASEKVTGEALKTETMTPRSSMLLSHHFWILTFCLASPIDTMTLRAGRDNQLPFLLSSCSRPVPVQSALLSHGSPTLAQEVTLIPIFKRGKLRLGAPMGWVNPVIPVPSCR